LAPAGSSRLFQIILATESDSGPCVKLKPLNYLIVIIKNKNPKPWWDSISQFSQFCSLLVFKTS
jgi:hypothetical protein